MEEVDFAGWLCKTMGLNQPSTPTRSTEWRSPHCPGVHRKYTAFNTYTSHHTHWHFSSFALGFKKKKKKEEILPWNLSPVSFICSPAAVTRDPRSAVCAAVRPQLRHASVKSSSRFHEADVERKHWRAASVSAEFSSIDKLLLYCQIYCIDILYANS